jgi:hypothetical protein
LLVNIMNMMIRLQKCPEAWKVWKMARLHKPYNEEEKDRYENWRRITLTDICYRIIFGRITDYCQMMNKRKRNDGDGIVCEEQKGFIKNINGCWEHSARINF